MARIISLDPPKPDHREALFQKLKDAPKEHVEAMLDLYEIIEVMRNNGVLEIIKGAVGSKDKILAIAGKTMESHEVINFTRNFTMLLKFVGGLNPDIIEDAT